MNNVTLVGRITKTPELRTIASGQVTTNITVAVNRTFTNANGEKVTVTLAEYISNLEALGIAYEKTNIMDKIT